MPIVASIACYAWAAGLLLAGIGSGFCSALLLSSLNQTMMPRIALQRLWFAVRLWYALCGSIMLSSIAVMTVVDADFRASPDCPAYLFCFGSWVIVV
jgi:hypothetical protein